MYIRPERHKVSIPQNYSGNLFSEEPVIEESEQAIGEAPLEPESTAVSCQRKDPFSSLFDSEELIILGLLLLLSQDGFGDDIIPILLIILLFRK